MTNKLRIIIEGVLSNFKDANLASEIARKKITDEIIHLYSEEDDSPVHADEIVSSYKVFKVEEK